jgi:hypothetical protein
MKELIRKILKENIIVGPDTPDWVEKFHNLPREGRIEFIKQYKSHIESIIPRIVDYFESKFGDSLVKIEVKEKSSLYGNENFSIQRPNLKFYFDFNDKENDRNWGAITKREIRKDLTSFFNIDISYYGTPLDIEVFQLNWTKI